MSRKERREDSEMNFLIGENLYQIRMDRDVDPKHIAKVLNITVNTYRNYEMGKTSIPAPVVIDIARFYHINPIEILQIW